MKSFFKKLSFVLAAAMIITLIPAQAAKAEGVIKLAYQNATSVSDAIAYDTLKVGEKQDYKFYGCLDYKTTGLGWVSSNEAVATVDKTGVVTAVAAGVTQISYEAKGYTTEAITLLVADTYNVSIAKQEDKTAVVTSFKFTAIGQEQDFCFVGAQGYSLNTHKCTWFSTNTAVATVDKVGNVTAVGEGNAQIVLTIVEKATNKVAFAVAPVAITVEVAKLEAAQTSYNTAKVTFNGEAAKDIKVYSVIDGERQVEYVESKDGVVTFYNELVNGREYVFVANGSEASFVASIAPVASFKLSSKSLIPNPIPGRGDVWDEDVAYVGQPTQVQISKFVDAAGIDVKRKNYTFEFEDVCDEVKSINYDGVIYIGEKNELHTVTVTAIDNKTGERVHSEVITLVGQLLPTLSLKKETAVVKIGTKNTDFDKCGTDFRISVDDEAEYALALSIKDIRENQYKFKAGAVLTGTGNDAKEQILRDLGQFVFESTDYDVLGVTDSGILEARAEGHATILIYFEYVDEDLTQTQKVLLTSVPVTVVGPLVPTTVTLKNVATNMFKNGSYVRLADMAGACDFNTATITYTVKDQLGREMSAANGLVVKATVTNDDFLDHPIDGNGISVTANNITTDDASITSNVRFTFTKNNVTKSASATIMVVNLEKANKSQVPGVAMCVHDDVVHAKDETHSGIGNTDVNELADNEAVHVGIHIVDVFYVGSAYVYGYDVVQSVDADREDDFINATGVAGNDLIPDVPYRGLFDYSIIKNLSKSAALEKFERLNGNVNFDSSEGLYVEIKLNNTPIKLGSDDAQLVANAHAVGGPAGARYIQVVIRKAFKDLTPDLEDVAKNDLNGDGVVDDYDNAMSDAKKLASIKNVKLEANVYDLYNTNTMESSQPTTTWKKGVCSKYDAVGTVQYDNNDEKNYAANLVINDLTYQGDIPAGIVGWTGWFSEHTDLTANVWITGVSDKPYKTGKNYAYTGTVAQKLESDPDEDAGETYVLLFADVNTMASNSKYIQSAGLYFNLYNTDDTFSKIVTYIPKTIGKKVTQENYQYKTEDYGQDQEFPGIWAD